MSVFIIFAHKLPRLMQSVFPEEILFSMRNLVDVIKDGVLTNRLPAVRF